MKNVINILFVIIGLILLSCDKEEIMSYEGVSGINFVKDSTTYSFLANQDPFYIQEIKIEICGDTTNYDRTFNVNVINDKNTIAKTDDYEIMGGFVEAGQTEGVLKVKLNTLKDMPYTTLSLNLEISDSKDFTTGNIEDSSFKLKWTNAVVVPTWGYFKYFMCRTASVSCYLYIIQSTGMYEFSRKELTKVGMAGAKVMGVKFGDFIKKWNLEHPDPKDHLKHSDGAKKGEDIVPLYYSKHIYQ